MVLRLVLVGIVAGLGATPPAESEVAGWSRTVQTWLDAHVAEWSVMQTLNERDIAPLAGTIGETSVFASLDDELSVLFADQTAAVAPAPVVGACAADEAFAAVVDEMVADFSQGEGGCRSLVEKTPVPPSVIVTAEADDLEAAVADAEIEVADDATVAVLPASSLMALPTGEDVFCELGDFDSVLLTELSPSGVETGVPASVVEDAPAEHAPASDPVRDAVRLTRDAVYAWINLLQSPALVTLPQ